MVMNAVLVEYTWVRVNTSLLFVRFVSSNSTVEVEWQKGFVKFLENGIAGNLCISNLVGIVKLVSGVNRTNESAAAHNNE